MYDQSYFLLPFMMSQVGNMKSLFDIVPMIGIVSLMLIIIFINDMFKTMMPNISSQISSLMNSKKKSMITIPVCINIRFFRNHCENIDLPIDYTAILHHIKTNNIDIKYISLVSFDADSKYLVKVKIK